MGSSGGRNTLGPLLWYPYLAEYFGKWGYFGKLPDTGSHARSVEVGMQDSWPAASLATNRFEPIAVLPGALFLVWYDLSGADIATYWARKAPRDAEPEEAAAEQDS